MSADSVAPLAWIDVTTFDLDARVRRVTEQEWSLAEAAEDAGVSERTACKWVGRYRTEGESGLWDRSSAPHRVPNRTPEAGVEAIAALRGVRMTGPEIAEALEMASSTVSAVLNRIGLGKLSRLEPLEPCGVPKPEPGQLQGFRWIRIKAPHRLDAYETANDESTTVSSDAA